VSCFCEVHERCVQLEDQVEDNNVNSPADDIKVCRGRLELSKSIDTSHCPRN
jgi:hypothetical protein